VNDLDQLFHEATDHVASPDLAGRALAAAHRRRVRRTAVGALSVVVLLGGGVAWVVQDPTPKAGVVDTPAPSPTPTTSPTDELDALLGLPTPPPIPESVVQPQWDPRTAGALPMSDVGLPASLDPPTDAPELTSMPPAVAMVVGIDGLDLVDREGTWRRLSLPEQPLDVPSYVRTSRLSTDGTRVVFLGRRSLWSRDVRSSAWRELDYPDGFLQPDVAPGRRGIPQVVPMVAEHLWLARDRWWFVDLDTERFEVGPGPEGAVVWGGGVFVESGKANGYQMRLLSWGPLGEPVRSFRTDSLQSLTGLAASADSLAAVRGVGVYGDPRSSTERNGLIALRLDDLSTRAYLPVTDPGYAMTDGGLMVAEGWLDADTVLASVGLADSVSDDGVRVLFTWNVETGALARVSTLPDALAYDLAVGALVDVPVP
jgi:hypothetical protein